MITIIKEINSIAWGPAMLILLAGTGLYLTYRLGGIQFRQLPNGFRSLFGGMRSHSAGDIPPAQALMTSLAATVGTGNIAGVATAIAAGGPGAIFWMWLIAILGMATKYAEAVLAVHYREQDDLGNYVGGPMYYIKNGLGKNWAWLAALFAFFGMIAGFGIGNGVQANAIGETLVNNFPQLKPIYIGAAMTILVGLVILGGIRRIAMVASAVVPFMALVYLLAGLFVILLNITQLPAAVALIFESAFSGTAATGGFAGATVWAAIQFGVARGVFSNEAGLGSAPIAHASAQTNSPVRQGTIAMLGTFIDTIIICSITAFVIILSGTWIEGTDGPALSIAAFETAIPGWGNAIVSIGLCLFAFTTILGWSVYSERCAEYLFGVRAIFPFRIIWVVAVFAGPIYSLNFIWLLSDTLNALMAIPNLIALLLLSPVLVKLTQNYFAHNPEEGTE